MATTFTGLRVQDTYNAILKIGDNSNLSGTAKILSDGVGNSSSIYLSTTRFGIGITPAYQFHTSGNAKIGGNLIISGDLTVNGDLTYLNVTDLQVEDPLIKLAKDNTSNTLDIGFFGKYVESATTKYTGLFWDASTDKFRLYEGLQVEPTTTVDVTGTGYTRSLLNADIEGNVTGTVSSLSNHDTNDLVEGSVNLYFTTNRARASFTAGTGVTITDGEIAIGQAVATTSNVNFNRITSSEDIRFDGTSTRFRSDTSFDFLFTDGNAQILKTLGVAAQTAYNGNSAASGMFNALNGYAVGTGTGTTVIDSSRNLTNIGTGNFSGQVTIPETPTADAHAASKKYVDDNTGDAEVAKRIDVTVKNVSGGSLAKGVVVHAAPTATPPSGNVIEVVPADANVVASMPAIGVLNETIADEAEGEAVMFGAVSGIDTSSFSIGDELYVSETAGEFTATKPTAFSSQVQKIAVVIKSHASNGLIKVFGAGRANDVPNRVNRDMNFTDGSKLEFGTDSDLEIYHDGTDGYIDNINGELIIQNNSDDKKIIFKSDNGIGDITEYFRIDGNINRNVITVTTQLNDNVPMIFGDGVGRPSIKYDSTASQLFISGESKFLNDVHFIGDLYGKSVNDEYSNLYKFGGIYFTWDSDSYGTNIQHSIRSTYNDVYGDNLTINSYGNVRINIDSNNNGGNEKFEIGSHTTGSANLLFSIDEAGYGKMFGDYEITDQLFLDRIETETGNYAGFRFKATDGTNKFKAWAYDSANNNIYVYNYNTNDEVLRIDNDNITYLTNKLKVGPTGTAPTFNVENVASGSNRYYVESTNNDTAGIYMVNKDAGTMTSNGTIRVNNTGYMQFFTGTTSASITVDIGPAGVLSTFLSTNSQDSIRFYNTDGNYSYIRTTEASNTNNVWFDGHLGSTMWHAWDNPGSLRTAGVYTTHYFGVGRGTTTESVEINRGSIIQKNSAGTDINKLNVSGVSYINAGNIGIGVTSAFAPITINKASNEGALNAGVAIAFDGGDYGSYGYRLKANGANYYQVLYDGSAINWKHYESSTYKTKMSLLNNSRLQINRDATSTYHGFELLTDGTIDWTIGQNSNGGFMIFEDGQASTTRLTIKDGGNIGINTADATIISGGKLVTHLGTNLNIAHNTTTINSTVVPRISSFNDAVTTTEPLAINGSPIYLTSSDVRIRTADRQTTATVLIRNNGSNIEFGHNNTSSGYFGTVGSMSNNGTPFISFSCSNDTTIGGNNFRTYGFKGNVIHGGTNGDLSFSQVTTATTASKALTTRMVLKADGNLYTTGFIGVGNTTSPQGKIDFGNAVNTDLFLYSSGTDYYGFDMRQYDSGPYGTNIFSGNNGVIRFRTETGGTKATRMLIAANGTVTMYGLLNVNDLGITNNLSVGNSARFEGTSTPITIGDGFGYGGSATICKRNAALYLQYNNGQASTQLNIGGGGTATTIHDDQNSDYHFGSGENSYFTEKLGVGVTTPDAKVDIHMSDSNGAYGRGENGNLNLQNTNTANTEGGWMSISGYMGNPALNGYYPMGAISGGKTSAAANGNYGAYLTLWTTAGGSNGVGEANSGMYERVRVTQSGATGIRTGSNVKTTFHVDSYGLANTTFGGTNVGSMSISDGNYSGDRTPCIDFRSQNRTHPLAKIGVTIANSGTFMKFGTSNSYSAGVTNQAMTINPSGNVAINLTDTSYKFQVSGESQIAGINFEVGNYPGIRFRENNGGTNRWKWGLETPSANQLYLYDYGANTSILQFVQNGNIYFNPTGNVSIGIAQGGANSYKFSVKGGGADLNGVRAGQDWHIANRAGIRLDSKGTSYPSDILFGHTAAANQSSWTGVYWAMSSRGTSSSVDNSFYFYRGGGQPSPYNSESVIMSFRNNMMVGINKDTPGYTLDVTGSIRATGDVIAFSDRRVKENIVTINSALEKVTKLRGVKYSRKDIDDKSTKVGVIAQEVLEVLPEVVEKDEEGNYSVAYGNMAGVFIEAIKELKAEVDSLKQEIKQLKK